MSKGSFQNKQSIRVPESVEGRCRVVRVYAVKITTSEIGVEVQSFTIVSRPSIPERHCAYRRNALRRAGLYRARLDKTPRGPPRPDMRDSSVHPNVRRPERVSPKAVLPLHRDALSREAAPRRYFAKAL